MKASYSWPSKAPALDNLVLLLRAIEQVATKHRPSPGFLVAWAPNLAGDRLRRTVQDAGGRWSDERHFAIGGLEVTVERARTILPVALALLKGCDRLASLDIDGPGGSGITQAPDKLA